MRIEGDKTRPAGTILAGYICGIPLAYWTYSLTRDGFDVFAVIPGVFAAFFLIGTTGILVSGVEEQPEEDEDSNETSGDQS